MPCGVVWEGPVRSTALRLQGNLLVPVETDHLAMRMVQVPGSVRAGVRNIPSVTVEARQPRFGVAGRDPRNVEPPSRLAFALSRLRYGH